MEQNLLQVCKLLGIFTQVQTLELHGCNALHLKIGTESHRLPMEQNLPQLFEVDIFTEVQTLELHGFRGHLMRLDSGLKSHRLPMEQNLL